MSLIDYADSTIQKRLKVFTSDLDAGGAGGKLLLCSGMRPSPKGAAFNPTQILATFTFPRPSMASVTSNVLTFHFPPPVLATGSGIPTWARFTDSAEVFIADCDAGVVGSNKPVMIDQESIYAGGEVSVIVANIMEV